MKRATETTHRAVAWTKDNASGAELAIVELAADRIRASGVAVGSEPEPYRLDYELETAEAFATSRLRVSAAGSGWSRRLELTRGPGGRWMSDVRQAGEV